MYICSIASVDAACLGHINNVQGAERHCRCFSSIEDVRIELKVIDNLHQEVLYLMLIMMASHKVYLCEQSHLWISECQTFQQHRESYNSECDRWHTHRCQRVHWSQLLDCVQDEHSNRTGLQVAIGVSAKYVR